ncbi:MAG: hypothetical protein HKN47_01675 [Pirellulaceae bacterium]|nr:hypothetical protein [Pirellulaceae bacterium]
MKTLLKYMLGITTFLCMHANFSRADDDNQQFYEVRSYVLGEKGNQEVLDQYLSQALLPALERQGIGPIGVFANSPNDESGSARIVVVIPYRSLDQIAAIQNKLDSDNQYQEAAKDYFSHDASNAPYQRIHSELLVAMDCWPKVKVPDGTLTNDDRVYELRLYESATERAGNLKVDMFNNGEVPIFLDCGIQPIFIGQCILGPQTPNLTYLTVYPNEEAHGKAWDAFRAHPDWQVLKKVEKYRGTVSKIDKYVLSPKPYSQM